MVSKLTEYNIPNARIGYYGNITKNFKNVKEIMPEYIKIPAISAIKCQLLFKQVKVSYPVLSIINPWYLNFYHFMFESMVKLYCLKHHIGKTKIAFPATRYKYHNEWLDLMDATDIIEIENARICIKAPLAISSNFIIEDSEYKKEILIGFRDWVLDSLKRKGLLSEDGSFPDKIFITRRNPKYRKIVNSNEVLPYVESKGYTVIDLEEHSLAEQINYFYHAKDIIGVHGAGYSHILFTRAPVLDIIVKDFFQEYFLKLSHYIDIRYDFFRCPGVPNDFHIKTSGYHDISIDIKTLDEYISNRK